MGFVDRELSRIEAALVKSSGDQSRFDRLLVAQQALKWTTEPQGFAAPLDMIDGRSGQATGILEGRADCSSECHPDASSDTDDR